MCTFPFPLKPLPYEYYALEPYIDTKTMYLHHDKHLKTYVDNLNNLLENYPRLHSLTLSDLILKSEFIPYEIRKDVINNAGGVYNHNLYFDIMGSTPKAFDGSSIQLAIKKEFHSFEAFKSVFLSAALKQFGSGYAWLTLTCNNKLVVTNTLNQNTPLPSNLYPLLLVDVWEHAYYLKYHNERKRYVENWFNTINWNFVEDKFLSFS
jgi:superoxide dismutase, Fe-Mn family